jgi:TonB-dependent receptor
VGDPFFFDEAEGGSSITTNVDLIGHADLSIPYELGGDATGTLKFGVQIRDKEKDQDIQEFAWELGDGAGDIILGQGIGRPFDPGSYNPGNYLFPPNSTTGDEVKDFTDANASILEREEDLESRTENYVLNERVAAAYVMTELNLTDRLLLLPGVRWERTDLETDGFAFDPDTESLTPQSAEDDYDNLFPMVHLRYRLTDRTNVRAAYTTAIARPNFLNLVPFRIRDEEDLELGNPELDATTAQNFDLLVEHYDDRIGLLSASFFVKSLDDPIFLFTFENELGGDTEQPRNGDSGEILGAELALQQQLAFLPAPFDGLGIYANYTWTDSEGELGDGRTAKLLGQADHTFNAALSYERAGFSGQLSLNFVDDYIDEYGDGPLEDIYVGARHQLDFSATYRVTSQGAFYVELLNLTNEPFTLHEGVEERPRQIEFYEPWGTLGFRITR